MFSIWGGVRNRGRGLASHIICSYEPLRSKGGSTCTAQKLSAEGGTERSHVSTEWVLAGQKATEKQIAWFSVEFPWNKIGKLGWFSPFRTWCDDRDRTILSMWIVSVWNAGIWRHNGSSIRIAHSALLSWLALVFVYNNLNETQYQLPVSILLRATHIRHHKTPSRFFSISQTEITKTRGEDKDESGLNGRWFLSVSPVFQQLVTAGWASLLSC